MLGLTQEQLAELISSRDEFVRQTDISKIERGQIRLPRRARLERLAKALEMPLGQLLAASGWAGAEDEFSDQDTPGETDHDTTVAPGVRQRIRPEDVPHLWEQFQAGHPHLRYIRAVMVHEWQHNGSDGSRQCDAHAPVLSDADLLERERASAALTEAAGPFLEHLSLTLNDIPHVVTLADRDGWILEMVGTPQEFGGHAAGIAVGASMAEQDVGPNGIGTALATRRPALIYGVERYLGPEHPTACLGVPVHGGAAIVGALGILVRQQDADPARLDLAQACARSIDAVLSATTALHASDDFVPSDRRSADADDD
jgi:transcriptional regulator with XRE-family HTH domain